MTKTKFSSNIGGVFFEITGTSSFQLEKLNFNNNEASNSSVAGMSFLLYGNSSLLVSTVVHCLVTILVVLCGGLLKGGMKQKFYLVTQTSLI